jgi:predicted RNase H-like HicB family nuclease
MVVRRAARYSEGEWLQRGFMMMARTAKSSIRKLGGYGSADRPGGSMRFTSVITREDSWFVARCLEIEVASQGHSVEEALGNLREALELYLEDAEPPELPPDPPIVASIEIDLPIHA